MTTDSGERVLRRGEALKTLHSAGRIYHLQQSKADEAKAELVAAVVKAHREGASSGDLADVTGMSPAWISKTIRSSRTLG